MSSEFSREQLIPFYEHIYQQASRLTRKFLIGFFTFGLLLAPLYSSWMLAVGLGGASLLIYFVFDYFYPNHAIQKYLISFLFGNFLLQFILQMKGLYEMHFFYFIALTLLLFFENWKVMLPITIHGMLSVLSLYWLQSSSAELPTYLSESKPFTTLSLLLHLSMMMAYSGICILWSVMQRRQTTESAVIQLRMNNQLTSMEVNRTFAEHISKGDLQANYQADKADALGQSLLEMRNSLVDAHVREEKEKFQNVGLAHIGEILRKHADNLDQLCDQVIEELVKYVRANQGSIFIVEGAEASQPFLTLKSCRAWDRKKFLQKRIELGQGLVGQAAIEKQMIFMTKVPDNYIRITSGLGEANPSSILIVPLSSEGQVVGVIELASFRVFSETDRKFMERIGESIAASLINVRNNQRNKELLNQSTMLAEQMKSQEEEMRQNMEEMHATQEEMERKNREIEKLLAESSRKENELSEKLQEIARIKEEDKILNEKLLADTNDFKQTLMRILDQLPHKIFLKDHEGKMALVNTAVAKAHGCSIEELIGKSDFDFVDAETAQQWRDQELEIIRQGSSTYLTNDELSGELRILKTTKSAFYIPHLRQTGLLGVQTDVTELETLRQQLKKVEQKKEAGIE